MDIRTRLRQHGTRVAGYATGSAVVLAVAVLAFWLPHQGRRGGEVAAAAVPASWQRPVVSGEGLVDRVGVRLIRVSVSGHGGLLDLRYQVVDPSRAAAVHEAQNPPAVVDEKTGLVINELFMGHQHDGALKAAVTYYLIFDNPGGWVHKGSRVTVLLGDAQVEHVVVQ
jgi:hypothetical protein